MKKWIQLPIALVVSMVILTGCPYKSAVPITKTGIEIPKKFVGKWIYTSSIKCKQKMDYFELKPLTKTTFMLYEYEYSEDENKYDTTKYTGHFSKVKNEIFMNVKDYEEKELTNPMEEDVASSDQKKYSLYKVSQEGDYYYIESVTRNIQEEFSTSESLYKYIEENMDNELFFDKSDSRVAVRYPGFK